MEPNDYFLIRTADELRREIENLSRLAVIGFDTETTSLDPYGGRVRLMQLAAPDGVRLIDLDAFAGGDAARAEALEPLRQLLAAPRPIKVAHNAKFDAKWVRHQLGAELGGVFDTLLASQLISAGDTDDRHGLEAVAARYLNETLDKSEQLSDWGGELTTAQLEYAARDAAVMLPLREKLIERLKANDLVRVAMLEFECVMPVAALELAGIFLDEARWREQLAVVEKKRAVLAEELQSMLAEGTAQGSLFENARADINLDSHTQLTAALKRLNVPVPDSTRNWKLQPLAADYPVVAKLLEYRTVQKALTSYGANILDEINPVTKRIHANFHQIGAPTGRFACTSPNVQQVPHAVEYRRCFRAPEGRKLLIADYCVAEGTRVATRRGLVRVENVRAGDEVLLENNSTARVSALIDRGMLPVVSVVLKNGYSLTATSLHRIRVLDEAGDYVWRRIGELKPNDFVAVQPERGLQSDSPYVPLPVAHSYHPNNHKSLKTPAWADERLALVTGYLTGDGTFGKNYVGWVVNSQDSDVAALLEEHAKEMFGITVYNHGTCRGVSDFSLNSIPLVNWCQAIGVSKSDVPEFLWESRPTVVAAFLRGLFEADGSVTDNVTGRVSFGSAREGLARSVHQLLLALGIPATLRLQENVGPEKRFRRWVVSVVASGLPKFCKQVGFLSARKQKKLAALMLRWTGKTVVGNMPNLRHKVRALKLSGDIRRLLNNTSSLGRPVSASLAATLETEYPRVADALGLRRITQHNQIFLPVVSIKDAGRRHTFDLSVPGPKTYISDGFVSHNSQIELRILAHITEDQGFIDAFNSGADLHRVAAAQVFNTPLDEVTKVQRDFAKRLNFGVVYGIGAQRFSMMTGLSLAEAEDILRRYFATYRALDAWLRAAAQRAIRERTARTMSGRLARFKFDPEDRQAASLAQRNGKNMPVQGCVNAGTRVFEKTEGYVPIETLVERKVVVWDGTEFSNARVAYSGKKQLVKVTLWGGNYIECSPDHRFLTIDVNGRESWRTPAEFVKGCWVVLGDDLPKWKCAPRFPTLEVGKAHNASRASLSDMSDQWSLGVWLGRLASDGSLGPRQLNLLVAEHEEVLLPELKELCGKFGHVSHRVGKGGRGEKALHGLTVSASGLCQQLNVAGVKTRIPDFAWRDSQILAGYLRGMFDGDGTVTHDGPALCFGQGKKHLNWAREIQQALLLFGVRGRINVCADRTNVCVLKRDSALFAHRIGFMNPIKQKKLEAIQSGRHDGKIYGRAARIKSVEVTDEWVDMYDVVDSSTERFMANGLVTHNSSADILKRALRLLHDKIKDTSARVVNIVHDEIVVEADAGEAEGVAKTVEEAMCAAGEEYVTRVPVKVETEIADEWVK